MQKLVICVGMLGFHGKVSGIWYLDMKNKLLIFARFGCAVCNKDMDTFDLPKIYTHDIDVETISTCIHIFNGLLP